jgi:hypothetical protein
MLLDITDSDVYAALEGFFKLIVPPGTPIVRGQQNRVPMPSVSCVVMTTIGAPRRIGTNAESIEVAVIDFTADSSITADSLVTADSGGGVSGFSADRSVAADSSVTADGGVSRSGGIAGFIATIEADFEYSVQADFYSPDAESWAMSAELLWRGKIGWAFMPEGMKPLYSEGRMQLPLVAGENQWIQRWTMTLVLDYAPTFTQSTQAATVARVVPEAIDVLFPNVFPAVFTADSEITADSDLTI